MYYYLEGKLALCNLTYAVVDCGGVGYKCMITRNTYRAISNKQTVKLYTYLNVKEDAMDLYGFADEQEQEFFVLLLSVSGVGPKAALAVLSDFLPEEFAACVMAGDSKTLTRASGVGAKMAQRICLELKDKLSKMPAGNMDLPAAGAPLAPDGAFTESALVLVGLGYSRTDAEQALRQCSADNTQDLVRQALKILSRHL